MCLLRSLSLVFCGDNFCTTSCGTAHYATSIVISYNMILHAVKGFALEFLTVFQVLDSGLGLEPIWLTLCRAFLSIFQFVSFVLCYFEMLPQPDFRKSHPWSTCMRPFIPPAQRSGRDVSGRLRPTSAAQAAWPATLPTSWARWLGPKWAPISCFPVTEGGLQVTKHKYINMTRFQLQ